MTDDNSTPDPLADPELLRVLAVLGVRPSPHPESADPVLSDLLAYWRSKLAGRQMPARADIDPLEIPHILPYLLISEVHYDPLRFRWRLIGTAVTQILGRDSTGKWFDEIYQGEVLAGFNAVHGLMVRYRQPVRMEGTGQFVDKQYLSYEALQLPLSNDGERVDMVLVGIRYQPLREQAAGAG